MEVKIVPTNKIVNIGYNNKNINIETDNEENININNIINFYYCLFKLSK